MHDQGMMTAKVLEHQRHFLYQRLVGYAQHLGFGSSRICKRPEYIKHGANSDFTPGSRCVFHSRMKRRSKHETYSHFLKASLHLFGIEVYLNPQGFQDISAAALTAHGAVAMFSHLEPGSGSHKGSGRRGIE